MRRIVCAVLSAVCLFACCPALAAPAPSIYLNGALTELKTAPYSDNGTWMIPFKETMEKLGAPIALNQENGAYEGQIGDILISVTPDTNEVEYDLIPFELDHICRAVPGDVMIEAEFLDKIYEMNASVSDQAVYLSFTPPPEKAESGGDEVEKYLASLPNPRTIISEEQLFESSISNADYLSMEVVEVDDNPNFDQAVELKNFQKLTLIYESQITMKAQDYINESDILVLSLWARSTRSVDESGMGKFNCTFEALDANWTKFLAADNVVSGEWTKFYLPFEVTKSLKEKGAQLGLRIGWFEQDIQFAGVSVVNYGPDVDVSRIGSMANVIDTYYGREEGALWREEALKRIDKYRVRDICVDVRDQDGNPVPGAKVSANMTKSEFRWGTAMNHSYMYNQGPVSQTYRDRALRSFNSMTMEGEMKPGRESLAWQTSDATNFIQENNWYFRCHNIIWDAVKFMPALNENSTEDEVFEFLCRHASRLLYGFGEYFDEIDVINEPVANRYFQDKYGDKFVADIFKLVRDIIEEVNPDTLLFVNEAGVDGLEGNWHRAEQIKGIAEGYLEKGAKIDGMGFEAHFSYPYYPMEAYKQMSYVAEKMDYMALTEYDFVSSMPDKAKAREIESDILRDTLIMAYSHPKMTGFTMWGFTDNAHWRGNAPLYNSSYVPKEQYKHWENLVQGEWFTQTGGVTDTEGSVKLRGHRGDYKITVEVNGGRQAETTLKVSDQGENTVTAVVGQDSVALTSSEPVAKRQAKHFYRTEETYEEDITANMYKQLYENKISAISGSGGENLDFLKTPDPFYTGGEPKKEQSGIYVLESGGSIVAELKSPLEKGVIRVSAPLAEETPFLCQIEGKRSGGDWFVIGTSDSVNQTYIPFNQELDQIRISGGSSASIQLNGIHVSKKEWVR